MTTSAQDPYIKDGVLYIDFYAHPTNPGDPPIKLLDVTMFYGGTWHHLCPNFTTPNPIGSDLYHCQVILSEYAVPPGNHEITVNVYDIEWKSNSDDHKNLDVGGSKSVIVP